MTTPHKEKLIEAFKEINIEMLWITAEELPSVEDFLRLALTNYEAQLKEEIIGMCLEILTDEIAIAHTTKSGTISRLTSAYNRIAELNTKG